MFQAWPYLNSLIIKKLPFSQQEHVQTPSHFPRQAKHAPPPTPRHGETRKISPIISATQRTIRTRTNPPVPCHSIDIYTRNPPARNSGQHTYVTSLFKLFLVLQDLIDRINSHFWRTAFQRNLLLIGF